MAGRETDQQRVQTIPHADLLLNELVPCVNQQLHVRVQVGSVHPGQVLLLNGDASDDDRVTLIILAAATTRASSLSGQVRGDIDDLFSSSQEQQRQRPTEALGALDSDLSRNGQGLDPGKHPGQLAPVGAGLEMVDNAALGVDCRST